ncbi:MAG: cadherin-like domain-containing protein, partial [Lentisphaeria bacterium]|nr:cadherin-like domain-containing protein [Lentisphaeria bacterium]
VSGADITLLDPVPPVNTPPTAHDDGPHGLDEGGTLTVPAPGVLGNDEDAEGNVLTAVPDSGPAHGALTLNADGSFTYVHDGSETTADSFTYRAHDGKEPSAPATVLIGINPVNDPPAAHADGPYVVVLATMISVPAPGVLANDTDPEGDPLTAVKITEPAHGTVDLYADGGFLYVHDGSETTADSFTYRADDGTSPSEIVTVALAITAPTVPLPEALDCAALPCTTGGEADWFGQTGHSSDGVDAARSGPIGDGQGSWLSVTLDGPGTIGFQWRTSSQAPGDALVFQVDGAEAARISGETGWAPVQERLRPGTHTLTWRYAKDASGVAGLDCGLVDRVTWSPPPDGDFEVGFPGAGGVPAAARIWDFSGHYTTLFEGFALSLDLEHDPKGAVTGTGRIEGTLGGEAVDIPLTVKAKAKGKAGAVSVKMSLSGRTDTASAKIKLPLTLVGTRLEGTAAAKLSHNVGGKASVSGPCALDVPAGMDGSFTMPLHLDLDAAKGSVNGTGELVLSNTRPIALVAKGKFGYEQTALQVAGDKLADPLFGAVKLKLSVETAADGTAAILTLKGKAFGQSIVSP